MSNLLSTINVGSTGLRVASSGINVTSHNVANATTEGYSRRSAVTSTRDPLLRQGHLYGQGARVGLLSRSADRLVDDQMVTVIGQQSRSATAARTVGALETYFDEDMVQGPATQLRAFYDSMMELKADPSDPSLRQQVVSTASRFTQSLNQTATAITRSQDLIQDEMEDSIEGVNEKLSQIAQLNERIAIGGGSVAAGDYADQRDELIREVAEEIGATVHFTPQGQATVFIGGHAAVSGSAARTLSVTTNVTTGAPQVNLSAGSVAVVDVTSDLGGSFGGLSDSWVAADGYLSDLDTFVSELANPFNAQHQAGFDGNAAAGGDFFTFTVGAEASTIAVDASVAADVSLFAAAQLGLGNAGDDGNLDLLLDLESTLSHQGGTLTGADALSAIYRQISQDVSSFDFDNQMRQGELADMNELRQSISGVDLDEEAANLMAWQAAYEASARVITTTNQLLDTLMAMGT